MTLKADIYQLGGARWYWSVYDADRPWHPLDKGRAEKHQWATALLDAQSALQRLHLKAFQDRVNETVRKLADIADYGVPRVVVSVGVPPPPPALVWEGDYA